MTYIFKGNRSSSSLFSDASSTVTDTHYRRTFWGSSTNPLPQRILGQLIWSSFWLAQYQYLARRVEAKLALCKAEVCSEFLGEIQSMFFLQSSLSEGNVAQTFRTQIQPVPSQKRLKQSCEIKTSDSEIKSRGFSSFTICRRARLEPHSTRVVFLQVIKHLLHSLDITTWLVIGRSETPLYQR